MKLESLKSLKFEALDKNQLSFITGGEDKPKDPPSAGITTCRTGDDNQHGDTDLADNQNLLTWYHFQSQQVVDFQFFAVN